MDGVILYRVSSLQVVEGGPAITYRYSKRETERKHKDRPVLGTRRSDNFLEREKRPELHSAFSGGG